MNKSTRRRNEHPTSLTCPSCKNLFQFPSIARQENQNSYRNKEAYRTPMVLRCGHIYCRLCIEGQVHSNPAFFCPVCQVATKLTGSSVEKKLFQLNYHFDMVGRLIAYRNGAYQVIREKSEVDSSNYNNDSLCGKCEMSPPQMLCIDCEAEYCSPCFQKVHFQSSGRLRRHVQIPTCKSGIIGQLPYCTKHTRRMLDMYCTTCNEGVCYACEHSERVHQSHELSPYNDVFRRDVKKFKMMKPRIENAQRKIETATRKQRNSNSNSNQDEALIEEIRLGFEHLHGILQMKENELIRDCSDSGKQPTGNLADHKRTLTRIMEDIDRLSRHETAEANIPLNLGAISSQIQQAEDYATSLSSFKLKRDISVQFDTRRFQELLSSCISTPGISRACSRATSHSSGLDSISNYSIPKRGPIFSEPTDNILSQCSSENVSTTPPKSSDRNSLSIHTSYAVVAVDTEEESCNILDEQGFPFILPNVGVSENTPISDERSKFLDTRTKFGHHEVTHELVGDRRSARLMEAMKKSGGSKVTHELVNGDDVEVIHINHPNSFFVQKMSDCNLVQKMFDNCQQMATKRARPISRLDWNRLESGDVIMAQYSADMNWYRARVFEINDSITRKLKVVFIDYGNSDWIEIHECQKLCEKLASVDDLASHCSLNLLPKSGSIWRTDDNRAFHRQVMMSTAEFMVNVKEHNQRSDKYRVDLMRRASRGEGALSVREWLVSSGHAIFPERGNELRLTCDNDSPNLMTSDADKTIDVEDLSRDASDNCSAILTATEEEQKLEQLNSEALMANETARYVNLPNYCTVRVSNMVSLDCICIAPVENAQSMVFPRHHPALLQESDHVPFRPCVGGLYGVRYTDGYWYRAVVEAVHEEDIDVRSVDFGVYWTTSWRTDLVSLQRKFLVEHYRAHLVSIIGITFENRKRIPSLLEDVKKIVLANPTYRLYYGPDTQIGTPNGNVVYLVNKHGGLTTTLVEKGLADFTDPSQLELAIEYCPEYVELSDLELTPDSSETTVINENSTFSQRSLTKECQPGHLEVLNNECSNEEDNMKTADEGGPCECDVVLLCEDDVCRLPKMPPCHITRFNSPDEFYVRMTDAQSLETFERLNALVQEKYCDVNVSKRSTDHSQLVGGEIVAVMLPEQSKWVRGQVLGKNPFSPDTIQVLLIDIGDTASVPGNYIVNPLDSSLIYGWNEMAVRCHVLGIQANKGGEWDVTRIESIEKILKRCDFRGQVSRVKVGPNGCGVDLVMKEIIRGNPDDDVSDDDDAGSVDSSVTRYISFRDTLLDLSLAEPLPQEEMEISDSNLYLRGRSLVTHLPQGDVQPLVDSISNIRLNGEVPINDRASVTNYLYQTNNNSLVPNGDAEVKEAAVRISLQSPQTSPTQRHLPVPNNLIGSSPGGSSAGSDVGNEMTSSTMARRLDVSPPGTQFLIDGPLIFSSPDALQKPEWPQVNESDPSPHISTQLESRDIVDDLPIISENSIAFERSISISSAGEDDTGITSQWKWPSWKEILDLNEGVEVQVRFVDTDLTFFCEPVLHSEKLEDLVAQIEERAAGATDNLRLPPKTHVKNWHIGEACFAYSAEKEGWCRAQILEVCHDIHKANVYFIDHGNTASLLPGLICPIGNNHDIDEHPYLSIPPALWRVKLHDIYPINQREPNDLNWRIWDEKYTTHISNDIGYRHATLYVINVDANLYTNLPTVFGRMISDVYNGTEIGEYLCQRTVAYRWEQDNKDQLFVKSPPDFTCYPTLAPFPVGVPLEVIVSAMDTPNELYLQTTFSEDQAELLSQESPGHEEWFLQMGRVNDYIRRSEIDYVWNSMNLLKDRLESDVLDGRIACIAKYSEDEKWYRAELSHAKTGSKLMHVQFVDYGNYDDVLFENLREPYETKVPCGCRRYRWKNVQRHQNCSLQPEELKAVLLDTLSSIGISGLYVKCERIHVDGRLPLMDLFRDKECTIPIIDIFEKKSLLQRCEIRY